MTSHSKIKKIYGPPGTGKTTYLLNIVEEELEKYKKGDKLDCIVFAVDADRERISLKLSE